MDERIMTVNNAMILMRTLRERIGDLKALRTSTATKRTLFGTKEESIEPQYDVKAVDKKIVEIQNALMLIDAAIKTSNSRTNIGVTLDAEELMAPIE